MKVFLCYPQKYEGLDEGGNWGMGGARGGSSVVF